MSTTSSLSSWLSSSRFFSSVSSHSPTSLSSFASSYWPWRALILLLSLYLWWCPHFPFFFTLPLYFLISSAGSASLSLLSVWWRKVVVVRRGYNSWWRGGLWFVTIFYGMCCQKSRKVHNSGCQFSNIQYEAVQDDVGTRHRNSFKKCNNGYNNVAILNSSWHLHQPRKMSILDDDVVTICPSDLIGWYNLGTKGVILVQQVLWEPVSD